MVGSWNFDLQMYLELDFDHVIYLSLSVCLSVSLTSCPKHTDSAGSGLLCCGDIKDKQIYSPTLRASYLCLLSLAQIYFAVPHTYCSE